MITLRKWNYQTQKYDEILLPNGNYKVYSSNMKEIIKCPHCLKRFKLGEGFSSKVFHTDLGFGYIVCPECHRKENLEEQEWREKNK